MRTGVYQPVSIRGTPAQEPPFSGSQRLHRRTHSDFDAITLGFGCATVDGHQQVMRVRTRVDRASDLGHPERHPIMLEEWEDQAELIPIEHTLRFADDDSVKTTVRILELTQQRGGSWSALPR
ncbi:putative ATPase [Streptomyces sp. NBRC 110611]|nr:putative ATPase [Streptomyces sp. NBRC 110611]